jgi:AcrR family transcriptional regulator
MPRSGLNTEVVVDAAARLADAEGLYNLTLKRLAADLDVRPPSLFSHVDGLADLRRQLQLRALREMTARIGRAAIGRAGDEAVLAAATAARQFAHEHPGLYAASLGAPPAHDGELNTAAEQFIGIFFDAMRQYGFHDAEALHAVRGLFSTIHGFIMLEHAGNFGMPVDVDESFRWLIERYIASLHADRSAIANGRRAHPSNKTRPDTRRGPSSRTGATP